MKNLLTIALLLVGTQVFGQGWTLDVSHSSVSFTVDHMVVSETAGKFQKFSGTVTGSAADFSDLGLNITIDVASINTDEPKRDDHLRSPDFFDAAKFPTITFKSTRVEVLGGGKLNIHGILTIRGVSKEVVIKAVNKGTAKNPWGKLVAGFRGELTINRKDYGLNWNAALEAGGVLVGEEVRIVVLAELNK